MPGHIQARHYGQRIGKLSDPSKRKEKPKWAVESPNLDNTRKLSGFRSLILMIENSNTQ